MEHVSEETQTTNRSILGLVPGPDEIIQGYHEGTQIELIRTNFEKNGTLTDALIVGVEGYPKLRLYALGQAVLRYGNIISTRIRMDDHQHQDRIVFSITGTPVESESCP